MDFQRCFNKRKNICRYYPIKLFTHKKSTYSKDSFEPQIDFCFVKVAEIFFFPT